MNRPSESLCECARGFGTDHDPECRYIRAWDEYECWADQEYDRMKDERDAKACEESHADS